MSVRRIRGTLGEGQFEVAYTDSQIYLIDSQTLTKIVIYYHPWHERWYAYLLDQHGNFLKRLRYISVCATMAFEYCERSTATGNLYVDALYCEKVDIEEINSYWQPARFILTAYKMGNRRPFYEWRRRVMEDVAKDLLRKIIERASMAESMVHGVVYALFGALPITTVGYMVTGYKYCAELLYGIYCRLEPGVCIPFQCRALCDIARETFPQICDDEKENRCIREEPIYQPIRRRLYGRA
jgi:hypothetical protein